eukprot:gb/GECH01000900.1/.p1 GENE.gb/GECH01000900.1/~~gb/GECH01000900.1/.p1  ORF type:complete len:231 (+),score=37.95 gb/GECH01000900.1/:1-693(+)
MTIIVGLTGGIATGKSTVSRMLNEFPDVAIIDADTIAREALNPGQHPYREALTMFGSDILNNDQTINRQRLGEIVFTDETQRKRLNKITHGFVFKQIFKQALHAIFIQRKPIVVLDVPLLFETRILTYFVSKTIVVYTSRQVQLRRLMARDGSEERDAVQRIDSQMPIETKREMAHIVLDNNESIQSLEEQVQGLHQQLRSSAQLRRGVVLGGCLALVMGIGYACFQAWT